MTNRVSFCNLLTVILVLIFFAAFIGDARSESFDNLRKEYFTLRNTDPELSKLKDWGLLSSKLESYSEKPINVESGAESLFFAAILREKIYRKTKARPELQIALVNLQELTQRFPKSKLADDALFRLSGYYSEHLNDAEGAKRILEKLRKNYPESELSLRSISEEELKSSNQESNKRESQLNFQNQGKLIVLDPGHGGEDEGALGIAGLLEKDVALDIAYRTQAQIEERSIYRVILTRSNDAFMPLADRTEIANQNNAALFVSLHLNASPKGKLSGIESFYLDDSGSDSALLLAERENESSGSLSDVSLIISELIQEGKTEPSRRLAQVLHTSLISGIRKSGTRTSDYGVRTAPFYVLVGAHMPCALIEMGFMDNPEEGMLLSKPEYRELLAKGLSTGIIDFLDNSADKIEKPNG